MRRCLSWIASIAIALAALADDDAHPSLVPWKVIEPGAPRETSPLVLFWVPSSRDEMRRSDLLTSDELTLYSSHCVAMRIVRLDDTETLHRLGIDDELPAAVLTDADGTVIARSAATSAVAVEAIVREELQDRAEEAEAMLDDAREKVDDGELAAAIAIYREVWGQRCVCPRQGRTAQKALKRLEK
jgi:hypothetical protein